MNKIFGATEFVQEYGVWQSKGHDAASKLQTFTVTVDDGSERINIGLLSYTDLDTVVFPAQSHATYAAAFGAIGRALDREL